MTESAKTQMLEWVLGLTLEQCKVMAVRWLAHYTLYVPPIRELSLDQNDLCAFAVGAMLERVETE